MAGVVGLASLSFRTEYRTGESDPVAEFYRPCLAAANTYSRAVGYFRSSIFLIVGADFINFAKRGAKAKLVCSPSLANDDISGIESGYSTREAAGSEWLIAEIDRLLADETTHYRMRVLATLIAVGALDIRIAFRNLGGGIYHEKLGLFSDEVGNTVSFLGSANETWQGWHRKGNFEAIEVFCGWELSDAVRVSKHKDYFERLWEGMVQGVQVIYFPEAAKRRMISVALDSLDGVDMNFLTEERENEGRQRTPLSHQLRAIEAWKEGGRRGILEHATGSGKTITALLAVKEHAIKGAPALIVVPSSLLLEQWSKEIQEEIPEVTLLLAGAGNDRWKKEGRLRAMTDPDDTLGPRVVLATMQTASTDDFLTRVAAGDHLFVVADEVHQTGSAFNSRLYRLAAGPRLGLSATPVRYGDPDGSAKMFQYFGPVIPPPITLSDAIAAGRLVEYEYKPHPANLTDSEAQEWKALTDKIRWEIGSTSDEDQSRRPLSEKAKILLIRRSRIAKKAANKVRLAAETLQQNYEEGHRWLVYCEDKAQLASVIAEVRKTGLAPLEYHSEMTADKSAVLAHFRTYGGIVVSIRCLDEGVDIPSVDHALILASSQNPRQFIQRRGRVLRKAPWKHLAVIHDAIVVPIDLEEEPEQTSLLKSEFLRAIEFAKSAINKDGAAELRRIAANLGFDPDQTVDSGFEEDEE